MRVLVCGGRDYDNPAKVHEFLYDLYDETPFELLISGAARGVDTYAVDWAKAAGVEYREFPADWGTFGKKAGALRNHDMLSIGKPDVVVAFPGGRGTSHMVSIAKAEGVKVIQV